MWFPSFRTCALAGALVAAAGALPPSPGANDNSNSNKRATACNNSPTLCDKKYNDITYLGAHDSYALRDDSTDDSTSGNQYLNATVALDAGLRMLQAQTQQGNTTLELCHTSCGLLDAGPLTDWLAKIKSWMDDNPNEVVTLLIVNGGSAAAADFNSALDKSGISKYSYKPSATGATGNWPTLQTMINDGTRLVTFVTDIDYSQAAPAVLPEFDYVFETAFEVTDISGFNCTLDRPSDLDSASSAVSSNFMGLVNHFKYQQLAGFNLPDVDSIQTVNNPGTAAGNLGKHLQQCKSEWGTKPSYILVDFWNDQKPLQAVDSMNGVSDATGRKSVPGGAGTSAGGRTEAKLGFGALLAVSSAALLLV